MILKLRRQIQSMRLRSITTKLINFRICLFLFFIILYYIYNIVVSQYTVINFVPQHMHEYLKEVYPSNRTVLKLQSLLKRVEAANEQREVMNWQKHGPVDPETIIIVIQVHRDLERLRYLVISLGQVHDIGTVLLIFSHSFYDENMNDLIGLIDFCMVLQIYYPYSVQLYPNSFPGIASDECSDAYRSGKPCVARDVNMTERKHQWWWTANVVFDQLVWAETHRGMVIFINEDSYVLPDLLHMFKFCKRSLSYMPEADVLSFGRPLARDLAHDKLTVDAWRPPYDNGLAFNISTWRKIGTMSAYFCDYDDTSWSYSLMHLFERFPGGRAVMMACMAPRVVSTGGFLSGSDALENIFWMTISDKLFPETVKAIVLFGRSGKVLRDLKAPPKGNGGWSDARDRVLCLDLLMVTATEDDSTTPPPIFTTEPQPYTH